MYVENKCDVCGRFMAWEGADCYVPFGGPADLEPPDEVWMCAKCSADSEEDQVKRGRPWSNWMPSRAERNAAKRLGFRRAGPIGAAWAEWKIIGEPLPAGWEWWEERERT